MMQYVIELLLPFLAGLRMSLLVYLSRRPNYLVNKFKEPYQLEYLHKRYAQTLLLGRGVPDNSIALRLSSRSSSM